MANRALGSHSIVIGWIDRYEIGDVQGHRWVRQGCSSDPGQRFQQGSWHKDVTWTCMKVAKVMDRRTCPKEIAD